MTLENKMIFILEPTKNLVQSFVSVSVLLSRLRRSFLVLYTLDCAIEKINNNNKNN